MRTQTITVPWLGETCITPYAWVPLTLGGWRFATLIQAPVTWVMLRTTPEKAGALPGQDLRPYGQRLRLGYSYPLDPDTKYEIKPCAFPPRLNTATASKNDADMILQRYGDIAGVDASQANELGGATTPTFDWRERRCIIVLSDEPLDEPGDLHLDVQLGAGAVATSNYMFAQTLHGLPSVSIIIENMGAFAQSCGVDHFERVSRPGDNGDAAASFPAIAVGGYLKAWLVGPSLGIASQTAITTNGVIPGIARYWINSSLGAALNRLIVRGRMRG